MSDASVRQAGPWCWLGGARYRPTARAGIPDERAFDSKKFQAGDGAESENLSAPGEREHATTPILNGAFFRAERSGGGLPAAAAGSGFAAGAFTARRARRPAPPSAAR